jgi:hypothetical protein
VFQVPGVKNPTMLDLVKPIKILHAYIAANFKTKITTQVDGVDVISWIPVANVQVMNFMAVMRNYKSSLIDKKLHVNLEKMEEIMIKEKTDTMHMKYIDFMLRNFTKSIKTKLKEVIGPYNPMNIAEMTYNTDRCFSLIIKFNRPSLIDITKKTTVKLLKKGKINFDGGNSQQEVDELYYWLNYIYNKYYDQILFNVDSIVNEYNPDSSDGGVSLYDA